MNFHDPSNYFEVFVNIISAILSPYASIMLSHFIYKPSMKGLPIPFRCILRLLLDGV